METTETPSLSRRFISGESVEYVSLIYGLVLIWGLGDVLSTYFAYAAVGTSAGEANPWIAMLLSYNPVLVAILKGAVVLYVGIVLLEYRELVQKAPGWRLWLTGLVVAGILVVVNNLTVGLVALA